MENYNKEIERNLYLRELLLGNIQGPLTGIPNIDRPWLKYYTKEELMAGSINKTVYRYLYDENKKYISNDENYNKMLRGTTLTESLYKYKIGEIEAVADETQKPSKIN